MTHSLQWYIIHTDTTGSTNADARVLARSGAAEGTVIVARKQCAGKGQWNRTWVSPYGGLYFSCILRPTVDQTHWPELSPLIAQAVRAGIAKACDIEPALMRIKAPNDVVCDDGKLSGILLESFDGTTIVVGCGVNVARPEKPIETDGRNIPAYIEDYASDVDASEAFLDHLLSCILREIALKLTNSLYN